MKKQIKSVLIISVLLCAVSSCSKETKEIYYIASEKCEINEGAEISIGSWYWARENESDSWQMLTYSISGFDELYEEGYEYRIKVKSKQRKGEWQDRPDREYFLLKVVSKEKKNSRNLP